MYVCEYCQAVTEKVTHLEGSNVPIHVCGPDCYDRAILVDGHNCNDYQEAFWDLDADTEASRCFVCRAVSEAASR